jgi:hypothetical protein
MNYRKPRKTPPTMPLFEWWALHHRQSHCPARVIFHADLLDAEGELRACIAEPGKPLRAFRNHSEAFAAVRVMEAAYVRR